MSIQSFDTELGVVRFHEVGVAIRTYIRADGRGLEVEAIAPCSHGDQRKVHRWTILKIGAEPAKESA